MRCITGHGAPSLAEATLPALQAPPQASTSTKPEPTLPFFFAWPGKKKACLFSFSLPPHKSEPRQSLSFDDLRKKTTSFCPTTTDDSHHRPSIQHRSHGNATAARLTGLSRRDDFGLIVWLRPQQQRTLRADEGTRTAPPRGHPHN